MKDFINAVKTNNVWLASVARAGIALAAAYGLELSVEQMAQTILFIEIVLGVGQAKANVAEPRVDLIAEKRALDIATSPEQLQAAITRRDDAIAAKLDDAKKP